MDGTHCCIKVEITNTNVSSWKGENCNTILQGICEYQVEEYLDTPSDVYGQGLTPNAVNISWATDALYWQPSEYIIEYCHKESLSKAVLPILEQDKCGKVNMSGHRGRHNKIVEDLEPFSEYEFKVIGTLNPFKKQKSTVALARTLPKNDIQWMITSSGVLKLSWLKKIANYKEYEKVKLELTPKNSESGSNETQIINGTAQEINVKSLKFGEIYKAKLVDFTQEKNTAYFEFKACEYCRKIYYFLIKQNIFINCTYFQTFYRSKLYCWTKTEFILQSCYLKCHEFY